MHPEALTKEAAQLLPKLKQFDAFYLAGGTALALQIGHRISVDFDLFCQDDISKELLAEVKRIFPEFKGKISPIINNPEELSALIGEVKVTFLKYPFPILNSFVDWDGLKMLDVLELSATKAYTIGRRGSFKDYVDLFFVLSENYANLDQIMGLAEKKYGNEFNSRLFLEQLVYLDDVEETSILFLKKPVDKKQIEEFLVEEVKTIEF